MAGRITHVIPVFKPGGAELQLATLAVAQATLGDSVLVLCLDSDQTLRDELQPSGVEVISLRHDGVRRCVRAARVARASDVIHSWMYHGFLLGAILRPFGRSTHVWGVRRTEPFSPGLKRRTRAVVRVGRWLAPRAADSLVFCTQSALDRHIEAGFHARHLAVTLNAIPEKFLEPRPDEDRAGFTVGCLTRWTGDKGIDVLLGAWAVFLTTGRSGRLLLAGPGIDRDNDELVAMVAAIGVADSVDLLGPFREPRDFHRSLDVYVSPSRTEGFPNVVAEAMATGLAVIATDVGGTPEVMGATGILVPNEDDGGIAVALCELADDDDRRRRLGRAARERCATEFTVTSTESAVREAYRAAGAGDI